MLSIDYALLFFLNGPAPPEIYTDFHTRSLHDALPIYGPCRARGSSGVFSSRPPTSAHRTGRPSPVPSPVLRASVVPRLRHRAHHEVHAERARQHREERTEEHTSELQSLMRISYDVFCL